MGMNEDIAKYGVLGLSYDGELVRLRINSTDDYNHATHHLHHFIKQQDYKRNKEWFDTRGIKQKLILLPVWLHEQVHYQAVKSLSNKEFKEKYKISRYDLVFNRRYSKY